MTALPPKGEVDLRSCYVADVPRSDSCTATSAFDKAGADGSATLANTSEIRRYHVSANPNVARRIGLQLHRVMVDANARDLRRLLRVRSVSAIEKG